MTEFVCSVQTSTSSLKPYMNHLLGNPSSVSSSANGLLTFLGSKEWALRKASADALKAIVVILGPEIDEQRGSTEAQKLSNRVRKTLNQYRFDKVSVVPVLEASHSPCAGG